MGANPIFPTALSARQLVYFYDPTNVGNNFSPKLNPIKMPRTPGNVRKYMMTTNGASIIMGQQEYPPKEIVLSWSQIDKSDYDSLRAFTAISPIVFVDNNDQGFLGCLVIDEAEQLSTHSTNVWAVKASFLVLGPYNGQHANINTLAVPTLSLSASTTGGYIPASTSLYVWATVTTPTGESLVGSVLNASTGATGVNTNSAGITFTAPVSSYYRKLSLYWNNSNSPTTATWLADIFAAQLASFTIFTQYIAFRPKNPPTYTNAFTGYWAGASWIQG